MKSSEDPSSSCSCTSSLFKSESERTSLIRIVGDRSRVDKFYIEKYPPLRERKLLSKLLKTRIIFDDIKNKLLSSSNISDDEKANLSRTFHVESRHISGLCSCCSCSTDFSVRGRTNKIGRPYINTGHTGVTGKRINSYYPAANARNQGSHNPRYGSGENEKSRSNILRIKKHNTYPETQTRDRPVRLNSKDIRSTPCLCPIQPSDIIKNESNVIFRRKKQDRKQELYNGLINECIQEENKCTSLKNNKEKQISLKYYKKLRYSKSRIKINNNERSQKKPRPIKHNKGILQDIAKKSRDKGLKCEGNKFSGDIKVSTKNANLSSSENINDNSVLQFKDNLHKKREWKCGHEYDSEECDLEECLEIILLNKVRRAMCDNEIQTDKKSTTSAQVQGSGTINVAAPERKISINIGPKKKENLLSWQNKIKAVIPVDKRRNIKSMTNVQPTGSKRLIRAASTGTIHTTENEKQSTSRVTIVPTEKKSEIFRPRTTGSDSLQLKLKGSRTKLKSIDIDIKPSRTININKETVIKSKPSTFATKFKHSNYLKAGGFGLKRCFCTLKLQAKRIQNKSHKSTVKYTTAQKLEKLKNYENSRFLNKIRQYECKPSFCVPGKCNPLQCEKQLSNRGIYNSVRFDTDYSRRFTSVSAKLSSGKICDKNQISPPTTKDKNLKTRTIERKDHYFNLCRYMSRLKFAKKTLKLQSLSKVSSRNSAIQVCCRKSTIRYAGKKLNTGRPRARSTSSMTLKINVPIKKVKSTLAVYKTSPAPKLKNKIVMKQVPIKVKATVSSPTRKVLRKCPSLDPHILMDKTPIPLCACYKKSNESVRERGSQGDAKLQKRSVFIQVDKQHKRAKIGSVLKRCFCTSKLIKIIKNNEKPHKENKIIGTEPAAIKKHYTKNTGTSPSTPKLRSSLKMIKTSGIGTEKTRSNNAFTIHNKSISHIEKMKMSNELVDSNSKQAVKFGSKFSFDIEFCKNYSHEVQNTKDKTCVPSNCKRKINKIFRIQPMLQKCFCTLRRLKNNKCKSTKPLNPAYVGNTTIHPNVFTVRRVEISEKNFGDQMYSLYNYGDTKHENDKTSAAKDLDENLSKLKKSKSQKCKKQKQCQKWVIQKKKCITFTKKKHSYSIIRHSSFQNEKVYRKYSRLHAKHSQLTGFSTYSKRCYCTMNVQAQRHNRKKQKLLDYECEPGVCDPYPGECDPNVCIQLINKRLMKSKMAGTGTGRSASSSSQSTTTSQARKLQSSVPHRTQKTRADRGGGGQTGGFQYKTAPNSPQRQVVRVGSSFSFNIEFAKDKGQTKQRREPVEHRMKPEKVQKHPQKKHMGTKGMKSDRNSQDSQSENLMVDKGSSGAPGLKRCFCTLKFHKKPKEMPTNANQGTMTPPGKRNVITRANAGQNTKPYKPRYVLDPHECEPNICIPGECDPYECLERIKRRNKKYQSRGTESIVSKSTSSVTVPKRHGREQQVQSKNYRQGKTRGSAVSIVERPSRPEIKYAPTDRQVVRIGSSFSFNIEFYKDRTPNAERIQAAAAAVKRAKKVQPTKIPKTDRALGVDKKLQSRDSQVYGTKMENRGTGMLKRCFCTLKLQKKGKFPIDDRQIIKVNTHGTKTRRAKEPATMYERGARANGKKLLPYECEPGVCVPGQCDPYECYKRIQNRLRETGTTTGPYDMRSASSMSSTAQRTKKMQHGGRPRAHGKPTQARSVVERPRKNKQAVRLGSDFSFNIEFYKDRSYDSLNVVKAPKSNYERPRYANKKPATRIRTRTGSSQDQRNMRSSDSQVGRLTKNVGSTVTSLKRCFCTLSLKKPNQKPVIVNRLTNVHTIPQNLRQRRKKVSYPKTSVTIVNRMHRLEPYECEPNVCIPGECDPLVCLERIKRRQKKNFGANTGGHTTKSVGSTGSISSTKAKLIQHKDYGKTMACMGTPKIPKESISSSSSNKQAVRIGSKFNFDVEFCKEKSYGDGSSAERKTTPETYKEKIDTQKSSRGVENLQKSKNKNTQKQKHVRDIDSQVLGKKMQSTMAGVSPLLKRCFCTLKLHSAKNTKTSSQEQQKKTSTKEKRTKPQKSPKVDKNKNSKVGTTGKEIKIVEAPTTDTKATRTAPVKYLKHPQKLEPYECETGVCIPGECDPYECEKRIRRREMQSKMAGTDTKNRRSVSSITAGEKRARGEQTKGHTGELINRQTGNTESYVIEQPRFQSSGSPHRQAVRISSSFSFNVEFYKDSSPSFSNQDKPGAGDSTRQIMHQGNTASKNMKNKNVCSQAICRDQGVCKQGICLRNRGLQAKGPKTETKGSGVGPMLKRCFCTLKLQKKGAHDQKKTDIKAINKKTDKTDKKVETANMGVSTKKKFGKLEPYECEPGICVPGECDPYECEKRIKIRNMKNLGTGTSPSHKSTTVCTAPCAKHRDRNVQSAVVKTQKDKMAQPRTISQEPRNYSTPVRENTGRQSLKIGSSFSCEIEFFKDRSPGSITSPMKKETKVCNQKCLEEKKLQSMQTKTVNRGCDSFKCPAKAQMIGTNLESKGTKMGPALKRCFCTLKLQNKENKPKTSPKDGMQDKKVATKKMKVYDLSPYECEPNTCIPGECDPYECLKRIKARNLRTAATTTATKPFSKTVATTCTAADCLKSKKIQSSMKDNKIKQTQATVAMKPVTLVEQPRFTNANSNRQAVKIGSNFKFDIEIFKDSSLQAEGGHTNRNYKNSTPVCTKNACNTMARKATKDSGVKNKGGKSCPTQAECLKTINQASGGNKILQRCFCTLKLQKKGNQGMAKAITVQRVAVQYDRNTRYRHRVHQGSIKKKSIKRILLSSYTDMNCKNCRELNNANWKSDEVITLFPYIPHKFHNAVSKTVIIPIKEIKKNGHTNSKEVNSRLNIRLKSSRVRLQKNKFPISVKDDIEIKYGVGHNIKNMFQYFKRVFFKTQSSKKKTSISYPGMKQSLDSNSTHVVNIVNNSNCKEQTKPSCTVTFSKVSKGRNFQSKKDCRHEKYFIEGKKKKSRCQSEDVNPIESRCFLKDNETENICYRNEISYDHCQINQSHEKLFLGKKSVFFVDNKVVQQALVSYKNLDYCGYEICGFKDNIFCPCSIEKNVINKSQNTEIVNKKDKKITVGDESSLKLGILKKSKKETPGDNKHTVVKRLTKHPNESHRPQTTLHSSSCQTKKVKFRKVSDCEIKISNEYQQEQSEKEQKKLKKRSKSVMEIPKLKEIKLNKKESVPSKTTKLVCKSKKPCACCRRTKEKNLTLAGGDQISQKRLFRESSSCVNECETKNIGDKKILRCRNTEKIKKRLKKSAVDKCNKDPLFEVKLHSKTMSILNVNELFDKFVELKSKKEKMSSSDVLEKLHGKSCRCCICQSVKYRKKRDRVIPGGILAKFRCTKSCTCGSAKCAEESEIAERRKKMKKALSKRKPCVCGTKICKSEALNMDLKNKIISKENAIQLRKKFKNEVVKKKRNKKKIQDERNYALRQKKYRKEDALRKKEKAKADKIADKQVDKFKNSSDALLLAESALDIAKMGINVVTGSLKCMCRTARNPKHTYRNLRTEVQDPKRLLMNIKSTCSDSGVVSTARRVKRRFQYMRSVNAIVNKLEENTVTNFFLHIFDKNPLARMSRNRRVRRREPVDFQCSLYMATLRKKPWLSIYYICPWFYPHCISLLNIWRQFTDVMLFLIAVFVWSPCLLAMEVCRAFMCCTLCTA